MALYINKEKYRARFGTTQYCFRYLALQRLAEPVVAVNEENRDILQITPDENVEQYILSVDDKPTAFVDPDDGHLTMIISFTLNGQLYYVKKDADWATWCNSEDNILGYYIADNSAIALPGSAVGDSEDSIYYIAYNNQKVLSNEKIKDLGVYTLMSGLE